MSAVHPDDVNVDPKSMLDWLVKQCICEWCDGTIDDFDCEHNVPITPARQWRNRQVKHGGYTSNHWKHWLICRKCASTYDYDFSKFIFPLIGNMAVLESLAALVDVQPMNQPAGEIFYMDYIPRVRGERVNNVVLDDDTFRDAPNPCGEAALLPITYGVGPLNEPNANGRIYLKDVVKP